MNKLKELRLNLKVNQTVFAKSIGIGQTYLSQIENGEREISTKIAYRVHKRYKISLDELINDKNSKMPNVELMQREIELLKQIIESQKQTITLMQKK